uniref:Uncharacterized protein n=1 Tax=Toxoplasma gondii (strain ATCC 50861 / VEG) TaxID=432359 RepID=A0A0F7V0I1_TOXGV|nr:TPA: hypothetical protein BN1205_043410 [Toxoplasma gondii VEG]
MRRLETDLVSAVVTGRLLAYRQTRQPPNVAPFQRHLKDLEAADPQQCVQPLANPMSAPPKFACRLSVNNHSSVGVQSRQAMPLGLVLGWEKLAVLCISTTVMTPQRSSSGKVPESTPPRLPCLHEPTSTTPASSRTMSKSTHQPDTHGPSRATPDTTPPADMVRGTTQRTNAKARILVYSHCSAATTTPTLDTALRP